MSQDIFVVIEHLRGQTADASYVMLAGARQLAQSTSGKVMAVLLGHNAQGLASSLAADGVLYIDHPGLAEFTSDAYQIALAGLIKEQSPRAVIFGHSSIGMDIASGLSAKLGLPIVSSCRNFTADGKFVSQICGGKIMAEGDLPGPTALVTMVPGGYKAEQGQSTQAAAITTVTAPALDGIRVSLKQYIEPDTSDVDIAKENMLVSVGRGIQNKDNIELANELAAALGCAVSASRPVVDQGWMPTTRLVGKSGKRVKPKIYLALGISGAPEHVEGMGDSQVIIAVNTDPNAPIYNIAKYGTTVDMFDLLPVLTDKVKQAK
ncbi:MAG: electron transfer flavoprotein subunit alpha/FixB family protein [Anaerolineales bacterium]|nr:electron transfer flavoprotein subunit alpha/FixB family protein [Anaerolineales bacterium]